MDYTELQNAIEEATKDDAFMEMLAKTENINDFSNALLQRGIEASSEQTETLFKAVKSANADELGEDELDSVSGGIGVATVVAFGAAASCVACVYQYYKNKRGR